MQVGVPGQGTGASEDAPHSPPKLGLPCDGRKKTAVAAVVRLESRDANLGHVFFVTGALCRKLCLPSSGIRLRPLIRVSSQSGQGWSV